MDAPNYRRKLLLVALYLISGLCSIMFSATASAFASDVCFSSDNAYFNCIPLPADCPPGDDSSDCIAEFSASATDAALNTASVGGQRSVLHMDYSFYLAQYLGFSGSQAYTIAAYSEAMDVDQYIPRGKNGALIVDPATCVTTPDASGCDKITRSIDGLNRSNIETGGVFFHFDSPYSGKVNEPVASVDGLDPDSTDSTPELLLAHVKHWADPIYGSDLLCTHGITSRSTAGDYATGSTCYQPAGGKLIKGKMAVVETTEQETAPFTFTVPTGEQTISTPTDGSATISSSSFDSYVGDKARYARIGIYLHAYQDRISHHRCLDQSALSGPLSNTVAFKALLNDDACVQGEHIIRHGWEVGVPQTELQPADQTMAAAVSGSYDELLTIAKDMGIALSRASDSSNRQKFIDDFTAALQTPAAKDRVKALASLGSSYGLKPMPGF
ncbi:MAG: hypothetical protein JWQ90_608 [Hydrocarboniphaga sp.]|uniref:hypothetical protein n=1 Tax=Hydrocarboniphaga sp. TaxID=2033016 RepID=UPI002615750C|nr:hypothetical protein [Hydrocarboniphaga sp.]MDB5968158.1 hypothetical protein [Hydrocarboniphaga sp.]